MIARPLTNLLKVGQFNWSPKAEAAFSELEQTMTTTLTLSLPNFKEVFIVETDASREGICAILTRQGKPVTYLSRTLGTSKKSWYTYAKYALKIIIAVQTWRPCLMGRKFYIQTNHYSLKYLLNQRITTPEQ